MPKYAVEAVKSYYHKVLPFYEEENEARNDLDFWRVLVAELKPDCVLELGAGTGRVTSALREFAPVVAIDLSLEMLQRAAARLHQQSTSASCRADLVVADMRRLAFARRFDLIVASNDPFAHITRLGERRTALRRIADHLGPGGSLAIEGLYRSRRKRMDVPERRVHGISVRESWEPLGKNDCWRAHYYYQRDDEHVDAEFIARAWNPPEVKGLFASCGLNVREIWGDFDRRPFTPDSERIILVADGSLSRDQSARTA